MYYGSFADARLNFGTAALKLPARINIDMKLLESLEILVGPSEGVIIQSQWFPFFKLSDIEHSFLPGGWMAGVQFDVLLPNTVEGVPPRLSIKPLNVS